MTNTNNQESNKIDIIYFDGPGATIDVFRKWVNNEPFIDDTAIPYSWQFFDFCHENNLSAYVLSNNDVTDKIETAQFRIESLAKKQYGKGVLYHLSQFIYALKIMALCLRFRPRFLAITSGVTYLFLLSPLVLFGIKIVPHMHNSLWANNAYPTKLSKKIILKLEGYFFKKIAPAILCNSTMTEKQIVELVNTNDLKIYQFRAQFNTDSFGQNYPIQAHNSKPFTIIYASRIEKNKGVFDLLDIAEQLGNENIVIHICGTGSDLEEVKAQNQKRGLTDKIIIHGRLSRPEILEIYKQSHITIVPTHFDFVEGFPKVAAESVLLNRPVICSTAFESDILQGAAVEVVAENIAAYIDCIQKLINDADFYETLSKKCVNSKSQFLDNTMGLKKALEKVYLS